MSGCTSCNQNQGHATTRTSTAGHPMLVQHWALPCHLGLLPIPDSCIFYFLSGGWRICGKFLFSIVLLPCACSPSRPPPFVPHITCNSLTTFRMTAPPPLLTTGNSMVHTISLSDLIIAIEPLSPLTCHLFCLVYAQFPHLQPNKLVSHWVRTLPCW